MEKDYLGSSGSRGYGKIKFLELTFDGQPFPL
jgi:CRISPR/Cas system CSM-associated protein Csm3 (group 7 of RAMP superfamily)